MVFVQKYPQQESTGFAPEYVLVYVCELQSNNYVFSKGAAVAICEVKSRLSVLPLVNDEITV